MFEGSRCKKAAKHVLKGNWKVPIIVVFTCYAISCLISIPMEYNSSISSIFSSGNGLFLLLLELISGIIMLASTRFFIKFVDFFINPSLAESQKPDFDWFLEGLSHWFKGILAYLWQCLWIWLWSLLFVIPGIVKMFAYSQMFYIIAENPKISVKKAMKISKIMTQGHKGELFGLGLSFIGWMILAVIPIGLLIGIFELLRMPILGNLLGSLIGGIGLLFFLAYCSTTFAFVYKDLKSIAINEGKLTREDFS